MSLETGLTQQQIRYRREKEVYRKYLERAKNELQAHARGTIFQTAATTSKAAPSIPSAPKADACPREKYPADVLAKPLEREEKNGALPPAPVPAQVTAPTRESTPLLLELASLAQRPEEAGKRPRASCTPPEAPKGKRARMVLPVGIKRARSPEGTFGGVPGSAPATPVKAPRRTGSSRIHGSQVAGPSWQSSQETALPPKPATKSVTTKSQYKPSNRAPSPDMAGRILNTNTEEVTITDPFRVFLIDKRFNLSPDESTLRGLIDLALTGGQEELMKRIEDWLATSLLRHKNHNKQVRGNQAHRNRPPKNYGQQNTGRGRRAAEYKKAQDLFVRDRKRVADAVLDGRSLYENNILPAVEAVESLFGGLLEGASPQDPEPIRDSKESGTVFLPVTEDEVKKATSNWRVSAPGTDGITIPSLKATCPKALSIVFTIILGRKLILPSWQKQRTVLVPKSGDRAVAANWRPITIGSAPQRLLHRILHARLRVATELNINQRGFTGSDGTLANVVLLDHYVQTRKSSGKQYNVVSLDISKAFDSVSHNSIIRALRRHGIEGNMVEYIGNTLRGVSTVIRVGEKTTRTININKGVKQGDPLSPFLFNLVVDELLSMLNNKYAGGSLEGTTKVAAIAFADDIVLLSDNELDVQLMLDDAATFLRNRGMAVNPGKSCCVAAKPFRGNKCPIPASRSPFTIDGVRVPAVPMLEAFKYLGHLFGPTGIKKPSLPGLMTWLGNLSRSPLKPDQRLSVLKQFIIPRLLYGLQNTRVDAKTLRSADRLIRSCVKRILHLPKHTNNSAIHASIRDGGLGVLELLHAVPQQLLGRLAKGLNETGDPVFSRVMQGARLRGVMERLEKMGGPIPSKQVWRARVEAEPMVRGIQLASEDRASRGWVDRRPGGWTGRDYVRAVHLRTGGLPTKGHPSNPAHERACRGGCGVQETVCHVLQKCHLSHGERIRRHNEVATKIGNHCTKIKKWDVETEPHVRHPDGTLFKPDLVIHKPHGSTVVVDVQVSWEGEDGLAEVWRRKERVYNNTKFVEAAGKRWPNRALTFYPIIVGARGIWPRCNLPAETELELTQHIKQGCVNSVLKWGSSIHQAFMRRAWAAP